MEDCTVFARVSPAHKVRIVKVFQKKYPIAISYKLIETISRTIDEHETT